MTQDATETAWQSEPITVRRLLAQAGTLMRPPTVYRILPGAVLAAAVLWAYWPTLFAMGETWTTDPKYSHGYLVPLFALYLLWFRRPQMPAEARPAWWGVPVLVLGAGLYFAGAYLFISWVSGFSLLIVLTGLTVFLGGWPALRWAWPSIAFLGFMLPLPYRFEVGFAGPLQRIATLASTYVLQTLGFSALSRGNIIVLDKVQIGVVEACSGLSMLVTFCALSAAIATVIRRPLIDRIVVLASAVPIALITNIARIVLTAILHETVGKYWADDFFHRKAGWVMMFLALGLLWLELRFLSWLLVPREESAPVPVNLASMATSPVKNGRAGGKRQRARVSRR